MGANNSDPHHPQVPAPPEDTPPGRELAPSLPRVRENVINMLHGAMPGKAFLLASRLDKGGPLS